MQWLLIKPYMTIHINVEPKVEISDFLMIQADKNPLQVLLQILSEFKRQLSEVS